MALLDKFDMYPELYGQILAHGENPFGVCMDEVVSATRAMINGRETILAGTNNYMGLTFDQSSIDAAKDALDRHGTGTTGSRFANGTYAEHRQLETDLAQFLGLSHCIVFSTGYQANLGAISALAGAEDVILMDADCHACIYDGCKLSGATIVRFRHNSAADLDKRLSRLDPAQKGRLVIVEGMYSMFGDVAPLGELAEAAHRHGAYFYVDEAHSFGSFGPNGRGAAEAQGVLDQVDFYSSTFSKSLSSIGGFCASNHDAFEFVRSTSRPYMFTASMSPANVSSVRAALAQIAAQPHLRDALWRNAERLHAGLSAQGFDLCAAPSPVVAVRMPNKEAAIAGWNALLAAGVYVNLAIPPGTPNAASLLRLSMSAAHTDAEIDAICEAFRSVGQLLADAGGARGGAGQVASQAAAAPAT